MLYGPYYSCIRPVPSPSELWRVVVRCGCGTEISILCPYSIQPQPYTVRCRPLDVLKKIHECIGCQDIHQKPSLSYKINGIKGAKKMKLDLIEDWQDLLEELLIIGKGKKDTTSVTIDIELPADVSHDNFIAFLF